MPARDVAKHGPDPIDTQIGERIRQRRRLLGMSQGKLGEALGVSYQQVQKYEVGSNRVSVSVLLRIARALGVPVGHFFEGLGEPEPPPQPWANLSARHEGVLLRGAASMPEDARSAFVSLAAAFADGERG